MKTLSQISLILLILFVIPFSLKAQEIQFQKKGSFDFGIGKSAFGPSNQVYKFMENNRFDEYTVYLVGNGGWIWLIFIPIPTYDEKKDYNYPRYKGSSFSFQLTYSQYISNHSQLGILYSTTSFRSVTGAAAGSELNIRLSNRSFIPFYSYELKPIGFRVGPAMMLNRAKKMEDFQEIKVTKFSLGLLLGFNINLWNKNATNGKLSTFYILTTKNKIGPFTVTSLQGENVTLPESKVRYSYLNFSFAIGINIGKKSIERK